MRYIGSKKKLLINIETIIKNNTTNCNIFCDIFSGTGIVGKFFKKKYKIIANDVMFYSFILLKGEIDNNKVPTFKKLKKELKTDDIIFYLNNLIKEYNKDTYIITNNYTPKKSSRMYFTIKNGIKIDTIRQEIELWKNNNLILDNEYYYLLATLIEAVPFISNITGTYGAYLKKWDIRALKTLTLKNIELYNNNNKNTVFNENSNELINKIKGDILYIDPPYTVVDYSSAYHVLETIAKYDNPEIQGITGQRVLNNKRSQYSKKNKAEKSLEYLIKNANFTYIIISYSNHGIIPENKLLKIIEKYKKENSKIIFEKIKYRKFKTINENKKELFEFLILFEKKKL